MIEIANRAAEKYRIAVCCIDDKGGWADELERRGIPVIALHRNPGFHPGIGWRIAQLARQLRVSVLHCHHYSPFVYGAIARACSPRLHLVFTEHGRLSDDAPSPKRRAVSRILQYSTDAVFAVSDALKRHMTAEGFAASRVGVVHNGIDVRAQPDAAERRDARAALGVHDDAVTVMTVARLDPVKNLTSLIEAFAAALAAGLRARLTIVGDGPELPRLRTAVAERNLAARVAFLGQRGDARRLMAGADLYVNCSIMEGISLSLLEAMAAAVPPVATAVGGTPEIIQDGVSGRLVPPRDSESLGRVLIELGTDSARRQQLARGARDRVVEHFTLERMTADYFRTYDQLLERDRRHEGSRL